MKLNLKICLAALLTAMACGCAFTDSIVKIDNTSLKPSEARNVKETITVERFTDQRGVEPNLLAYKGVRNRTSGRYLCDQEVSMVVTDTTKAFLASLGYSIVNDGGDYSLSGELLRFDSTPIMGLWSGQLEGIIQLNLRIKDVNNGNVIWNEMLSGTAKKTGLQIDGEDHRKVVAENTLDNLMQKIAESQSFKKTLETKSKK